MKRRDDNGRLQDVLDSIKRIRTYTHEVQAGEFEQDVMRQDAVIRQLEIIGEASRSISVEFQERHPEIPWSDMIGMRNKIAHDYSDVDIAVIWDTVRDDIPQLEIAIVKLIDEL